MKQILLSMVAILIAAGIFVGMVCYSISVIRSAQIMLLTGETSVRRIE